MREIAIVLAMLVVLASCDTPAAEPFAQLQSLDALYTSPGYPWFATEVDLYNPDVQQVEIVRTQFDPSVHKILIFVKPSSICLGVTHLFPQVMKTLLAAGVDMTRVEVWSMRSITDKQPYQPMITIVSLPSVFVLRNDTVSAMIPVQDYSYLNADTLLAQAILR